MNFHESAAVGSAAVAAVRTADHHHEQQLLAAEAVRQAVERCQNERVSQALPFISSYTACAQSA